MENIYLKHQMSCLKDQAIEVDIDHERREVRLGMRVLDSSLVARLVRDILPEQHGVEAFRDDNQVLGEHVWITKPSAYKLLVDLSGVMYKAQVVRLFNSQEVAVTLEGLGEATQGREERVRR